MALYNRVIVDGPHTELLSLTRKYDIAHRALVAISESDYRGNRPIESVQAEKALLEIAKLENN